jgi:hypothetical protein
VAEAAPEGERVRVGLTVALGLRECDAQAVGEGEGELERDGGMERLGDAVSDAQAVDEVLAPLPETLARVLGEGWALGVKVALPQGEVEALPLRTRDIEGGPVGVAVRCVGEMAAEAVG